MIQGIDHLVIVVNDLEGAADDYRRLGFTVVPGGQHPVGSHNVLISFQDGSYLEIIAFYREARDHRWWKPLQQGERLVDFCFQTNDLRGDTEKLRQAGVAINNPVPWSRTRPDGYQLKWLLALATADHRGVAPFLIEDITPRSERIPQDCEHENGVIGIDKVTVAVGDVSLIDRWYRVLLGVEGQPITDASLRAAGLSYQAGAHRLEFLTPQDAASPLGDWLRKFGPSPFSALLRSRNRPRQALDSRWTHGANLFLA